MLATKEVAYCLRTYRHKAYYSRCLKGFHMSGQAPYGFRLEPTTVEGIPTKIMVSDPAADWFAVRLSGRLGEYQL
jgi:hypothetical protein